MRLPFPERIPLIPASYFAGLLCVIQLIQGTDPTFALCCFLFILVATLAFNVAGGLTRPSGSYVFFFAILGLIVGIVWKAVLGEPADSNLQDPILSVSVYLGCICSMLVAVFISRRLTTKRSLLGDMLRESNAQRATVGCMICGMILTICYTLLPAGGSGSVLSALAQLNGFYPLAVVIGVTHTIRRSGGTRSVNLPVLLVALIMFVEGVVGFSKQGIITPFMCWAIAAAAQRYRVSRIQVGIGFLTTFFIFHYLVPYAQYGRNFREESQSHQLAVSLSLLSNLGQVRQEYLQTVAETEEDDLYDYYNTPQGFFDRLQALSMDDAIISYKNKTSFVGIYPLIQDFENLVPHFIWRDKPTLNQGNVYAHEVGLLGEEDDTTGISFSPAAESYILLGWTSVFLVAPLLWITLFTVFDSLLGDTRKSPWGLLCIISFAHAAPEGGLGGIVYMLGYAVFATCFLAIMTSYAMPVIGTFFLGPEGISIRKGAPIRSIQGRLRLARPSEG